MLLGLRKISIGLQLFFGHVISFSPVMLNKKSHFSLDRLGVENSLPTCKKLIRKREEEMQMAVLQPLKYVFAFSGGIAVSTYIHRRLHHRNQERKNPEISVSPYHFLNTASAHVSSAVLKSALELEVFDVIGVLTRTNIPQTFARIAKKTKCSEKGMRILLDYLTAKKFLLKSTAVDASSTYKLTPSSAKYLDKASPSYIADSINWLAGSEFREPIWNELTNYFKSSPPRALSDAQQLKYAASMGNRARPVALKAATIILSMGGKRDVIVDVGSSHGVMGTSLATQYFDKDLGRPKRKVISIDSVSVQAVPLSWASKFGLGNENYIQIKGSPIHINWGTTEADAILFFDYLQTCSDDDVIALLRKAKGALSSSGAVYIIETCAEESRDSGEGVLLSIPIFALTGGSTRTFSEFGALCSQAGFEYATKVELPNSTYSLIAVKMDPLPSPLPSKSVAVSLTSNTSQATSTRALGKAAKIAARDDIQSSEEISSQYPMSLGDFFNLVGRMVMSSITKNPFE